MQRVAIAGYGVEGQVSARYWLQQGADVTIADERDTLDNIPDGTETILGENAFTRLQDFDLVIRSAGVAPRKITTQGQIWSATNEFFAKCPAPIIGVTGTKGKGTTSSLIASILEAAGKTVHLLGNIGVPALETLPKITPDDIVVYELSSFQLWDLERSPHVAVVLMIEPDHLDVHADFDEYVQAKTHITRFQTADDVVVWCSKNEYSHAIAAQSAATTRYEYPFESDALEALVLPGVHNRDNASAAIAATREFVTDEAIIRRGLAAFHGLPHRLQLVAEVKGVRYYDDSISTTPGSAIAAVKSFPENRTFIILGGSDKGASYEQLVAELRHTDTYVVAIGQTGNAIAELCKKYQIPCTYIDGRMDAVIHYLAQNTHENDVVILSPASASFDQYRNYVDRGEQFTAAVQQLLRAHA